MRTFIGGNGSDTTSAVNTYLAGRREMRPVNLCRIGEREDPLAIWFTNWESPLLWPIECNNTGSVAQPFLSTVATFGKVTSQVGLKVDSLTISWSPKLTAFGTSLSTANPYQLARAGFYDNRRVYLWRGIMPSPGDVNTYGACQWFGGRVSDVMVSRGMIKFTVTSFLDVVNQQVPPNVIETSNSLAGYVGATAVLADSETAIAQFTVVAPSNTNVILGRCTSPTANKIYSDHRFRLGYLVFNVGSTLAGFWSAVGDNTNFNAGGGTHYNQFQTYSNFPWAPTPGDTFYVSTQMPVDQSSTPTTLFKGFPYVPAPTTAV